MGWAIYYFTNRYAYVDFYKRLELRAVISAKSHLGEKEIQAEILKEIREKHIERLPSETEIFFPTGQNFQYKEWSKKYKLPQRFFEQLIAEGKSTFQNGNTLYTGIRHIHDGETFVSIVSANQIFIADYLINLQKILWIAVGLATLLALILAYYFSKRVFNPVRRIISGVKKISSDSIHLRLEESDNKDEIAELIRTFNDLLNRLETSFETQKNFISQASHEFGTPLTSIIGVAEVTLKKERESQAYKEALDIIVKEADKLDRITRTLLALAQTGYKNSQPSREKLRTDELLWEMKGNMDSLYPGNKVQIDLAMVPDDPKKLKIAGNRTLLHLALSNIVGNAIKYSQNGEVKVSVGSSMEKVYIVVQDQGIGIPAAEIPFIYDPFFRASNTGMFEGYGIGLPLTRNIIRLHEGNMEVKSEQGKGTIINLQFPQWKEM